MIRVATARPTPLRGLSLDELSEDVRALLQKLGITRTHFIGLSMGGMIGQIMALKYPQMLESLVLCDTMSRVPTEAKPIWDDRIHTAETGAWNRCQANSSTLVYRAISAKRLASSRPSAYDDPYHAATWLCGLLPCHRRTKPDGSSQSDHTADADHRR